MTVKFLMWLGSIPVSLIFMIWWFVNNQIQGRYIWSFFDNDWVIKNENGTYTVWYSALIGVVLSGVFNFAGSYMVIVSFQTSIYSGVNQGVISSLFVLSALFSAMFAFIILGETLNISQYLGMALLIVCAVLLSLSNSSETILEISPNERLSPVFAVLAGIASSFFFGIRSIISKYFVSKGYNVYNFAMQFLFVDGIIGTVWLFIQYETFHSFITSEIFLKAFFGGLIASLGIVLINYSISIGIAGPASALANLATVIQTLLDYLILGQLLDILQILGLVIGISGAMILAIGMEVISLLRKIFRSKRD